MIANRGPSKESGWRIADGAVGMMAVEMAKESSDMLLPLRAVIGALAVFIKDYDVKNTRALPRPIDHLPFVAANYEQCRTELDSTLTTTMLISFRASPAHDSPAFKLHLGRSFASGTLTVS